MTVKNVLIQHLATIYTIYYCFILYLIILFLEESVWALKQTIFNAKNQKS